MPNIPKVQYPTARHDMILYLKDLSDFEMQKRDWVKEDHPCWFWANKNYCVEMLLDEGDLDQKQYALDKIGYWFVDKKEALMCHGVAKSLKKISIALGHHKPDQIYLNSPLWQDVVASAKEAYDYIMSYEDTDALLLQCKAESQK